MTAPLLFILCLAAIVDHAYALAIVLALATAFALLVSKS